MSYVNSLKSVMDFSVAKREAISNNIANLNTPNFKTKDVSFVSPFEKRMEIFKTNKKHLDFNSNEKGFVVNERTGTAVRTDGNNVDLNKEMVELMKNNSTFSLAIEALNKHSSMRSSARGK